MAAPWDKESLLEAIKRNPEFSLSCPTLASDIATRRLELVKLVEYLKDLLTDPEPSQRSVGTLVLSTVLRDLPGDFLREDEVRFIAAFFCDRLKDHHDVVPAALKGFLSILRMKNLPPELPAQILNTLMLNLNCQGQRQEDRLNIFRILDLILIPHLDCVRDLGPDLVYHVMTAIDGERDPRNLVFLFSLLPAVLKALPLGHLTEDFFDILACYYPVDFKPTAEDRNNVTRDQLANGLGDVLTAVPGFAEFTIPLLLEKLDSDIRLAKLDSLHLLIKGCQRFPAEEIAVHLSPIWVSLSREAFSGPDYDVREAARVAVTHLLRCLADIPRVNNKQFDPMKQLLSDVVAASSTCLSEIQTSLFMPAADLLLAAAKSVPMACEHILTKVLPSIVDNFHSKQEAADRSIYLRIISRFMTVCKSQDVTPQNNPDISMQWNLLLKLYFSSAEHEASLVRKEALFGLTTLAPTLTEEERKRLYNLLGLIIDKECAPEVREQCKLCLCEIGRNYPSEISNCILPDKLILTGTDIEESKFERRVEAQCCLAALPPFAQQVLPNIIDLVVLEQNSHQIHASLSSIRKLLHSFPDGSNHVVECLRLQCNVVPRLINWWISSVQNVNECIWVNNEAILYETCSIISAVTRNSTHEDQLPIIQEILDLFYPGCDSFRPCEPSSPKNHLAAVALLEAVFGCLYCSVPVPEVRQLSCSLAKLATGSPYADSHLSASRLCASLINKMPNVNLDETLDDISIILNIAQAKHSEQDAVQAASLCGWLIKGLSMRGYQQLELWIDKLINILGDSRKAVALSAAQAFRVVMEDSPIYLNNQSHCTIRLLYKQRVFVGSLKLVQKSRESSPSQRFTYLMALTNLLSGISESVLTNNIGEVLPLLLESLSTDSTDLIQSALDTLLELLNQEAFSDALKDHIQTMVPRLLPLTTYPESMKVRSTALCCLYRMCSLKTELLLPFKTEVVDRLAVCLNDSKRIVRKGAVKARSKWIFLAAPGTK